MAKILTEEKIFFTQEKTFKWLKNKGYMFLDFYLPDYNIAIECQGIQHFQPVDHFGGEEGFAERQMLDALKYELCNNRGIDIIYYSNIKLPYFQKIETEIANVIKKIKKYEKS